MFPPMELDGGTDYYLKPMNCPFHILIFRSRQRSYRDLPLRLFEFGTVYRYEKSGVVHGLTRVRGMTQDDAHIFCTKEQMGDELEPAARLRARPAARLRPRRLLPRAVDPARGQGGRLRRGVGRGHRARCAAWPSAMDLELVLDEGGGAFYGPKISVQARDAIGRTWQMSTIQLDFQTPQRFGLEYVGADDERHAPIMIHRALFGSIERFFGVLVEHYAGAFPPWLAPVQVRVLPVRDDHDAYARRLVDRLQGRGLPGRRRSTANEPLGKRIREAKLEKLPVRARGRRRRRRALAPSGSTPAAASVERGVPVDAFVDRLAADVVGHLQVG